MQIGRPASEPWDIPAVAMSVLGLVSGILSALVGIDGFESDQLEPVGALFWLDPAMLPVGLFFGAVVAAGVFIWGTRRLWAIPVVLLVTMYAWSAAINSAVAIHKFGDTPFNKGTLVLACLVSGALGAAITQMGAALFVASLRRPLMFLLTTVVGAIAGLMLYLDQAKVLDIGFLFVVWQAAVAAAIGAGFPPSRPVAALPA